MSETFVNPSKLLTPDDVAAQLTRTVSYIQHLCRTEKIGHYKMGKYLRFDQGQVDAYLKKHRVEVFVQPEKKTVSALDLKTGRF